MAFSVTNIGTGSSVSGASFNIAVPAGGVPAGATIVVFVSDRNGSIGSQAVADSKGNTYTRITSVITGTSTLCSVYYAYNVSALSSGDTITITKAATDRAAASALYVTGIASGDTLDSAATNTATVSNGQPSVASNTPGTANDLFLGAVSTQGASGTFTQDSTHGAWSTPPNGVSSGSGSSDRQIAGGHLTGSGTSTQTYAPTFSSTPAFASSIIIALKPSAGGGNTLSISATEGADTAAVTLHLTDRVSAALQESPDTLSATVHLTDRISAALVESPDVLSATLSAATGRSLSAALVESADTLAATLHLTDRLSAALVESADTLAATLHLTNRLSASLQEAPDVFAATIITQPSRSISAAIVERPDGMLMTFYPLYLESVPFFDGASFSDGARFMQIRKRQFVTRPSEGNEWTNESPSGDPWTIVPDGSSDWITVN